VGSRSHPTTGSPALLRSRTGDSSEGRLLPLFGGVALRGTCGRWPSRTVLPRVADRRALPRLGRGSLRARGLAGGAVGGHRMRLRFEPGTRARTRRRTRRRGYRRALALLLWCGARGGGAPSNERASGRSRCARSKSVSTAAGVLPLASALFAVTSARDRGRTNGPFPRPASRRW
jgi:hypothetical protein